MTKTQTIRLFVMTAAALGCSAVFADSMDMTVQATVSGTCKMVSVPTIDFGTLDPSAAVAKTPTGNAITYKCTKGTAPSAITLNTSASPFGGSLSNGVSSIPYTITWSTPSGVAAQGSGFGTGSTAISVTLSASLAAAAYENVTAGNYAQTVAVAITP